MENITITLTEPKTFTITEGLPSNHIEQYVYTSPFELMETYFFMPMPDADAVTSEPDLSEDPDFWSSFGINEASSGELTFEPGEYPGIKVEGIEYLKVL